MNTPYGGKLVLLRKQVEKDELRGLPVVELTLTEYLDLHLLADGVYSPFAAFMNGNEATEVMENMKTRGRVWSVPILLSAKAGTREGDSVCLSFKGEPQAACEVEDRFSLEQRLVHHFLGTSDSSHPGLKFFSAPAFLGASNLRVFASRPAFKKSLTPTEVRAEFANKGWNNIATFHTRNFPHLGHERLQREALAEEEIDGLFLHPLVGEKKEGDVQETVILEAYEELLKTYPQNVFLATLAYSPRFVGPKEVLVHALMRRNFGCTHFIVGRDHGGVNDYYPHFEAQKIFDSFAGEMGIKPLAYPEVLYCVDCKKAVFAGDCPSGHALQKISGTMARERVRETKSASFLVRPEVERVLKKHL